MAISLTLFYGSPNAHNVHQPRWSIARASQKLNATAIPNAPCQDWTYPAQRVSPSGSPPPAVLCRAFAPSQTTEKGAPPCSERETGRRHNEADHSGDARDGNAITRDTRP